ncbi:MAG: hypothetical protein JHC31_03365 [Sulfurihydrogenibium sp.]|jgi:hypothetical protein|nr:hypothetical protein [Sulfurihydrogenibium sp.]
MIAQIFNNMQFKLKNLARSKFYERKIFRMAEEITKRLIANQVNYDFMFSDNAVYIEELDKSGRVVEVVKLDLNTGEYVVMDLEKYLKGGY